MKIYLAGPFWYGQERPNIEKTGQILRKRGFEVFIPMEHQIEGGETMSNEAWGKAVFEMDKKAIYECDVLVALYYGLYSDSGTAWEIGFANCLNKKVVVVHCESEQESSLMIVNGASLNLANIEMLSRLDFENLGTNTKNLVNYQQK